jgi:type I restriction enzyme S subunit
MSFPHYPTYMESGVEWLGKIPQHWEVRPLRGLAKEGQEAFIDGDWIETPFITDQGVRLIQTGNVGVGYYREQGFRYISPETFEAFGCTEIDPGDILICRLADPVGRACLAPDLGSRMITSVDVCILKPRIDVNAKFVVYMLSSAHYLGFMASHCRGGTRDRVSRTFLGSVRVCVPNFDEQASISVFLDRETAKIDELVAKQQRLIELLKEKRQAVISHAVTKGLNPHAPMKPSSIEWLGDVPAHWEVSRISNVFREVAEAGVDDLPILSVSIHHGVSDKELEDEDMDRKVTRSDDRSKYKRVAPGDLVYNMMRAWQGGFGTVSVEGMVSPAYVVARPRRPTETAYIEHLLRTPQAIEQMRRYSRGVTDFRLRLYWDEFKNLRVALPPREEMREICAKITSMDERFDTLSACCEASIDILQERRAALISAAVSGQIDVRAVAERQAA